VRILRGVDPGKDQTYFLWGVPREVLPYLRFPVGDLTKPEVRERARGLGLATAEKPESQEICFVPSGDYAEFLGRRLGSEHRRCDRAPW
jgi:tRNA-uridine 2-sulfurtransferase